MKNSNAGLQMEREELGNVGSAGSLRKNAVMHVIDSLLSVHVHFSPGKSAISCLP